MEYMLLTLFREANRTNPYERICRVAGYVRVFCTEECM